MERLDAVTRDTVLELIRSHPKGVSYRLIQAGLKLERAALDPILAALKQDGKIRSTLTGYTAIDEAREARVYGSTKAAKTSLAPGRTQVCQGVCGERKSVDDYYPGLNECKSCYKDRCNEYRRDKRRGQVAKLVHALNGIASCSPACEVCEVNRQIAAMVLADLQEAG